MTMSNVKMLGALVLLLLVCIPSQMRLPGDAIAS